MNDGGSVDGANDAEHNHTNDEDEPLEFATHSPTQPQHGHQLHHHQHHSRAASRSSPFSSGRHLAIAHRNNNSSTMLPVDGLPVHRELAAATRDLDLDDDELQQAIQQSLQQRRPGSAERTSGGESAVAAAVDSTGSGMWVEAVDEELAITSESTDLHLHEGKVPSYDLFYLFSSLTHSFSQ